MDSGPLLARCSIDVGAGSFARRDNDASGRIAGAHNRRLKVCLETVKNLPIPLASTEKLHRLIFEGLCRVNQDFREVTKMFDPSCVEIQVYEFETGPFKERDIGIKNRYVAQ